MILRYYCHTIIDTTCRCFHYATPYDADVYAFMPLMLAFLRCFFFRQRAAYYAIMPLLSDGISLAVIAALRGTQAQHATR